MGICDSYPDNIWLISLEHNILIIARSSNFFLLQQIWNKYLVTKYMNLSKFCLKITYLVYILTQGCHNSLVGMNTGHVCGSLGTVHCYHMLQPPDMDSCTPYLHYSTYLIHSHHLWGTHIACISDLVHLGSHLDTSILHDVLILDTEHQCHMGI